MNYSHAMLPVFSITGPSNQQYDGTFCLPQVPLPAGFEPKIGENASIQVIELAQHGASLFNCADITFADPKDVPEVTKDNCFNSTQEGQKIGFQMLYTTTSSPAPHNVVINAHASILTPLLFILALCASWI